MRRRTRRSSQTRSRYDSITYARASPSICSSLPYELVALAVSPNGAVSPYYRMRCVVRFYRVRNVLARLEDSFELQGYVAITRLILSLTIAVHWVTCCWFMLGTHNINGWAHQVEALRPLAEACAAGPSSPEWEQSCNLSLMYLKSLYWVASTLITVGYGDISRVRTLGSSSRRSSASPSNTFTAMSSD